MAEMSSVSGGRREGRGARQRCAGSLLELGLSVRLLWGSKRIIFAFVEGASNKLYGHLRMHFQLLCWMDPRETGRRVFLNVPGRDDRAGREGHAS